MVTLALRRYRRKHILGGNHFDTVTGMPDHADNRQTTIKNPADGKSKNLRNGPLLEKYKSAKLDHVTRYYALKTRKSQTKPANTVKAVVPKASHGRHKASNFIGLGVLCAIGTVASIQTGPFPLNFALGAVITLLFAREAIKWRRLRRASASSQA